MHQSSPLTGCRDSLDKQGRKVKVQTHRLDQYSNSALEILFHSHLDSAKRENINSSANITVTVFLISHHFHFQLATTEVIFAEEKNGKAFISSPCRTELWIVSHFVPKLVVRGKGLLAAVDILATELPIDVKYVQNSPHTRRHRWVANNTNTSDNVPCISFSLLKKTRLPLGQQMELHVLQKLGKRKS